MYDNVDLDWNNVNVVMICIMRDELQIHHFDKVVSYFNEYFNKDVGFGNAQINLFFPPICRKTNITT